jgi:ubiquinone/menaquinone biosynthesis C-methylase UbiE
MLTLRPGEHVLEIACGNGEFSRRMTGLGAHVLATDFSEAMLDRARSRGGGVEYRRVDATDGAALRSLGDRAFDAVVCNQAIMDMTDIEPMASALPTLLAPGGRFVFSTMHPAFKGNDAVCVIEQSEDGSGVVRAYGVKVMGYATPSAAKGVALEGQPVTHWYFHRPLTDLLGPFFAHGLVVDGLDEPVLDPDGIRPGSMRMIFTEIPLVVVARMRVGER